MTAIAALVHNGRVHIAGDSAGVSGWSLTVRADTTTERACQACGQALPEDAYPTRRYCTDADCIKDRQRKYMARYIADRRWGACSTCNKPMKGGRGSKPPGERVCLECRRAGLGPKKARKATTMHDHTCQHCGTQFQAKQADRKYCSQTCSMRGYLGSKSTLPPEIAELRRMISRYPQETEAILTEIKQRRQKRDQGRSRDRDRAGVVGAQWEKARARVKARREPCWICGGAIEWDAPARTPRSFSVDHIHPRSKGGDYYALTNLATAHYGCNSSRGNGTRRPRKAAQRATQHAARATIDRW